MNAARYNLHPHVPVAPAAALVTGWDAIADRLRAAIAARDTSRTTVVVECYPGVDEPQVFTELALRLQPALRLSAVAALRNVSEIDSIVAPFIGDDDPVFGRMNDLDLSQFFSSRRVAVLRNEIDRTTRGLILVVGCGARLIADGDLLVYADLSRREAQLRQRRGIVGNLGADNRSADTAQKYKRAFFIDWRVADRWKRPLIEQWDFVLDTHDHGKPKLADGDAVRQGLQDVSRRPFRVVPWFDPAPWGGQWLRGHFDLPSGPRNYGWGFDCVPEENSLLFGFGQSRLELPAQDLVLAQPRALLGEDVYERFGAEFPIRFDFLDTMGGGHLSFQVHPTLEYIRRFFGMAYTQDESYYIIDAAPDATVFLGLQEHVDAEDMLRSLRAAGSGGAAFPVARFVNRWPARRHDHFLIPAGTVHCSGRNAVVLEISATPYIFTFKLWDWARLGLDGKPRPIHLEHGAANIQWNRRTEWTRRNLLSRVEVLKRTPCWTEERTGLHESQFIETRRHWFTGPVPHDPTGSVHVLNLVAGESAVVESPTGAFPPLTVSFAETFIVPAAAGGYTVTPLRTDLEGRCATVKAYVRPKSA